MSEPSPVPAEPGFQKILSDVLGRLNALEHEVAALRSRSGSLAALVPYIPPSQEELHDMLHGPRGQSPLEVIEEYEKKHLKG